MSKYSHRILNGYRRDFTSEKDAESFEALELARWALRSGRVKREAGYAEKLVERQLAREFAEAMREDYSVDPQGRTVREMHAARIGGRVRWSSRLRGSRPFVETSIKQRRSQIVDYCCHLKTDVDSFNDNRWPNNPIQLVLVFTDDVAEVEAGRAVQKKAS
jgi:hypothetical protein